MTKLAWVFSLAVLAVAAGGTVFYYLQHQQVEQPTAIVPTSPVPSAPVPEQKRDDEMQRRKIEGIGSTKSLKPVPIPQGNARYSAVRNIGDRWHLEERSHESPVLLHIAQLLLDSNSQL
ncbi:hypothetical protein WKW79_33840, partial [Variovorax robiniae]